jgi:hypothetical protein
VVFGFGEVFVDEGDGGGRGAAAAGAEEFLDGVGVALHEGVDGAVDGVADPAGNAEAGGGADHPVAVADALDDAFDAEALG